MLEKREADVIIIGGGIMGCATAYRLAKQGVDVLVLEKKEIGTAVLPECRRCSAVCKRSERIAVGNVCRCKHLAAPERRTGVDVEYHQGGNLRLGLTEKDIKVLENHTAKSLKLGLMSR
ncbi:MAG: FAD-dependent oxidoreductase [Ruminococcus sp.]